MKFIKNLVAALRANIKYIIAAVLFVAVAVGVFMGYRVWLHRQSAPYAFEQLEKALHEGNVDALAKSISFRHIFDQLGEATAETYPFFMHGEHQRKDLSYLFQTTMLQLLKTKAEDPPKKGEPDEELFKPVKVLPHDFMAQIIQNLTMRVTDAGSAILTTSVHHEQLGRDFPIILNYVRHDGVWMVRDLLNAPDLLRAFNEQLIARFAEQGKKLHSKNQVTLKKMNEILPIESCSANAGLLADQRTLLIAVHVLARNTHNIAVNNMNLHALLTDSAGNLVLDRYLNAVQPTQPGEDFTRQWIIELDGNGSEGQRIRSADALVCVPEWRSLGLNTSQVLHTDDVIDPSAPCETHNRTHPAALCREIMFNQGKPKTAGSSGH